MKWFQHYSDSHGNLKFRPVLKKHGLEGYGLAWILRELAAKEGKNFRVKAEKDWKGALRDITGLTSDRLEAHLSYQAELGLIDRKALEKGDLYIPKLKEYCDTYSKKLRRVFEHSTDNVLPDNITLQNIRLEYTKIKGLRIEDFSDDDFKRSGKAIYALLARAKGNADLVKAAIGWASKQGWCDWTLETIARRWPDFMKIGQIPEELRPFIRKEAAR